LFSKLKNQLPPAGLLAAGLVVVTLLTALSGLVNYSHNLAATPAAKVSIAGAQKSLPGVAGQDQPAAVTGSSGTNNSASSVKSSSKPANTIHGTAGKSGTPAGSVSSAPAAPAQPPAAPQSGTISVALSVNGSGKGHVSLAAGSNQCDVLSQALAEGVISSLTMRYYSQYGSEAVYVIDGIGDPGTVRWTYTVNGTPPPYGCTLVTAHSGDSINWQYN
jgi:hypothetical protein